MITHKACFISFFIVTWTWDILLF